MCIADHTDHKEGACDMSKKLVSVIITVGFILILVIMAAIMIKGLIDQNNDEDAQIARYESLKTEGGKTTLTIDIMEEDHTKYVEDAAQAKKTFITLLVLFGAAFLWIVVTSTLTLLGFAKPAVEKTLDKLLKEQPDCTLEELIKRALKQR